MKEEKEKTPLQLMVERMGNELAQAVEDAIANGAHAIVTITGGVLVDGVYFGAGIISQRPTLLLEIPNVTLVKLTRDAALNEKRLQIEKLKNELKELEK